MKAKILVLLFSFLYVTAAYAQYPEAPEKWSMPEKIAEVCLSTQISTPSISWDEQKLYMSGIWMSNKKETGWSAPIALGGYVSGADCPTISPDGKKLYYRKFYGGGWRLYYSVWDSLTGRWGASQDCGEGVNGMEYGAVECAIPNDTTMIFVEESNTYISYWDSLTGKWGQGHKFPTYCCPFASDGGVWADKYLRKIYYVHLLNDLNIYVSYKDTAFPVGYTAPKKLNICNISDSLYGIGEYKGNLEIYPSLSPDGKTLYFAANYDSSLCLYVSRMLIDENGNPVSVNDNNGNKVERFNLYQNYPNPFNPLTTIKYDVPKSSKVTLKIYNMLGKEVAVLVNDTKEQGSYTAQFNAAALSSGVYFYQLQADDFMSVKKMMLIK